MRRTAMVAISALIASTFLVIAQPAWALNTAYYVDAVSGSDSNAGTSPGAAWQSLAKVNATTFSAGDQILFHTDQSWAGQLWPKGSGAAGNPIVISSYGNGDRPLIDGSSMQRGATVYLKNQSYWTVEGLEVMSDSGRGPFVATESRWGILAHNEGGGTVRGITIQDNYVHDVNGCFDCTDIGNSHTNGGIVVGANIHSAVSFARDSFDGVQILNNVVENVGRTGIHFEDVSSGFYLWVDPQAISKNITIAGNHVSLTDSDGITVRGARDVLIEHNVVEDAGQETSLAQNQPMAVGIWPAKTIDTLIQYNEVYRTQFNHTDGQGYDVDLSSSNTTLQYNYSEENEGGFLLLMYSDVADIGENVTVRYNVSVNDGTAHEKGIFAFSYGVKPGTHIYNNTIWVPEGSEADIMHCETCNVSSAWSFRNNIVANFGSGEYGYPTANAVFDSNTFYGNHPASEPADPNKLTSDPLFLAPPTGPGYGAANASGLQIPSTSPSAGTGVLIAGNGGLDYFGNAVSSTLPPSRGFHEPLTQ
ncbi:MAG: right-handed parallel beta-helix repeat-containing protein [Rhodoglobus sp.]|nr:right-handed parallel beta-helix repeat-containing protein [Rhodoglobus sp.]